MFRQRAREFLRQLCPSKFQITVHRAARCRQLFSTIGQSCLPQLIRRVVASLRWLRFHWLLLEEQQALEAVLLAVQLEAVQAVHPVVEARRQMPQAQEQQMPQGLHQLRQ